jgi:integrase
MSGAAVAVAVIEQHRRRRSRGQGGSIVKRGDTYSVVYRTREGNQKWEGGFRTKDLAQTRLGEVLPAIRNNSYVEPQTILFRQFCDDWMDQAKRGDRLKPKTWSWYESCLKKWITPKFGKWPICDINRPAVQSFIDSLLSNPKLGHKFVKNTANLLHRLFEKAIDLELIALNPARKLDIPKGNDEEVVPPTSEELSKVLAKLPTVFQYLVIAGAFTGARRGELFGLRWNNIDFARGTINVQKTIQRVQKKLLDGGTFRNVERLGNTGLALLTPKTKESRRLIEMGPVLRALLERMDRERNGCEFVFHDDLGRPIDPDRAGKIILAARKEAGVKFHLHLLRHLHGSLMVEGGANIKQTQTRLGHANASTTADIYTHVVSNEGRKFSEKVEAALPCVSLLLANGEEKPVTSGSVNG